MNKNKCGCGNSKQVMSKTCCDCYQKSWIGKPRGPMSEKTKEKLRIRNSGVNHPMFGKHQSEETIKKRRRSLPRGEKSNFWTGGSEYRRNKLRGKEYEYRIWTRAVKERDNYTCRMCGFRSEKGMCAHHLDLEPDHFEVNNGVCLCNFCHSKVHKNKEYYDRLFLIISQKDHRRREG